MDADTVSFETMRETVLSVEGMTCGSCTSAVTNAVQGLGSGIASVDVSLVDNKATVRWTGLSSPEAIAEAIEDVGFEAAVLSDREIFEQNGKRKEIVALFII